MLMTHGTVAAVALIATVAHADTRQFDCKQTTNTGVEQVVHITISEASDAAEVALYAISADCARQNTCGTEVFRKTMLPSVLRLTNTKVIGRLHYSRVIDIDRSNLRITSRTDLRADKETSSTEAVGTCKLSTPPAKRLF